MKPIHTDFCDYDDSACGEFLRRKFKREPTLAEVTAFQQGLAMKAMDLLNRCQALLGKDDRVAAVRLYRVETGTSLPAAMQALGLT